MAGGLIGSLRVALGLDSAQFTTGLAKARGELGSFSSAAKIGFAAVGAAAQIKRDQTYRPWHEDRQPAEAARHQQPGLATRHPIGENPQEDDGMQAKGQPPDQGVGHQGLAGVTQAHPRHHRQGH